MPEKGKGGAIVPMTIIGFKEMRRVSKSEMAIVIRSEGRHQEARWRMEFLDFYKWLVRE